MKIFETKKALIEELHPFKEKGMSIGFVPTMGALHQGHISLIEQCRKENSITVASIFVNPTQFNDQNDLVNYPRTFSEDVEKLNDAGCDGVFAPAVKEMYPEEDTRQFDFGMLDKVMEGAFRPGHFNGVAQVVTKLFDIVQPEKAYFGEKDFQQLAIIRYVVKKLNYPVEIVACPIIREPDGLAMSSRNTRLDTNQRKSAPLIAQTLFESKKKVSSMPLEDLKEWVVRQINRSEELNVEYFDIVDRESLQSAKIYKENALQGCIAVFAGEVRLIDNIAY